MQFRTRNFKSIILTGEKLKKYIIPIFQEHKVGVKAKILLNAQLNFK